jgi:hypothetical protein
MMCTDLWVCMSSFLDVIPYIGNLLPKIGKKRTQIPRKGLHLWLHRVCGIIYQCYRYASTKLKPEPSSIGVDIVLKVWICVWCPNMDITWPTQWTRQNSKFWWWGQGWHKVCKTILIQPNEKWVNWTELNCEMNEISYETTIETYW